MATNRAARRAAAQTRYDPAPVEPAPGRLALTVPEAAYLLNISGWHAWNLVQKGELPSFKVGRRRLVARTVVEQYIAEGTDTAGREVS
jgi:excisionase family DNA binding protein